MSSVDLDNDVSSFAKVIGLVRTLGIVHAQTGVDANHTTARRGLGGLAQRIRKPSHS